MRRIRLNRLSDEEFYRIIRAYSRGVSLSMLLKKSSYTPERFIRSTLNGDFIKARDFCLATRKLLQRKSAWYKKAYKTNRCIPLKFIDKRCFKKCDMRAYLRQAPLSKREVENIDNFLFDKEL